jgi:hypothetical protein
VDVAVTERLGLRYVDAFQADVECNLGDYKQPGIRGINLGDIGARKPRFLISLITEMDVGGKLAVRELDIEEGPISKDCLARSRRDISSARLAPAVIIRYWAKTGSRCGSCGHIVCFRWTT